MSQTVIGIFDSATDAQEAVQNLVNSGFDRNSVDVTSRDVSESHTQRDDDDSFGNSISNFFSNLFGGNDDDDARKYSEVAKRGCTVTVHAQSSDEAERAAEILDDCGAIDVDERAQSYQNNAYPDKNYTNNDTTEARSIPIIEEDLQVGKREVESGGARLNSRIVERPVEESLRLRNERVNIERNPVNRPATDADFNTFKEGSIEITEHREVPVVNKEARVVEEVSLNKEVEETEETIRDTVRKTEVDVDKFDSDTNDRSNDSNYRSDGNTRKYNDDDSLL